MFSSSAIGSTAFNNNDTSSTFTTAAPDSLSSLTTNNNDRFPIPENPSCSHPPPRTNTTNSVFLQSTPQLSSIPPARSNSLTHPVTQGDSSFPNFPLTLSFSITNSATSSSPANVCSSTTDASSYVAPSNQATALCNTREAPDKDSKATIPLYLNASSSSPEPSVTESIDSYPSLSSVCITPPTQSSRSGSDFVFTREQLTAFHAEIDAQKKELKKREAEITKREEELKKREDKNIPEPWILIDENVQRYIREVEELRQAVKQLRQVEKERREVIEKSQQGLKDKDEQIETLTQTLMSRRNALEGQIDDLNIQIDDLSIQNGHLEELLSVAGRILDTQASEAAQFKIARTSFSSFSTSAFSTSAVATNSSSLIQPQQPPENATKKASSSWCAIC